MQYLSSLERTKDKAELLSGFMQVYYSKKNTQELVKLGSQKGTGKTCCMSQLVRCWPDRNVHSNSFQVAYIPIILADLYIYFLFHFTFNRLSTLCPRCDYVSGMCKQSLWSALETFQMTIRFLNCERSYVRDILFPFPFLGSSATFHCYPSAYRLDNTGQKNCKLGLDKF